jgi:hypothetical protein
MEAEKVITKLDRGSWLLKAIALLQPTTMLVRSHLAFPLSCSPRTQGGLGGSTQLAIEIDGDSHFQDGAQEYDWERQAFIESAGIRFLRFTNNDVYRNLESVLEIITRKVRELR